MIPAPVFLYAEPAKPGVLVVLTDQWSPRYLSWDNPQVRMPNVPPDAAPMFRDIRAAGYTTAQIAKLHWTSGPSFRETFGSDEGYYKALGLDYVLPVNGGGFSE